MADDSVRRSGRATKGQHTKNLEEAEIQTPKRGKGGRKKQAEATPLEEEEEDAIIRCVCGVEDDDEDVERTMICCDECAAWQHNECMEITEDPDQLPEQYYCEQCRPEDHMQLLAKIARGERPWEERAKQREREAEEKRSRKKKGGKKGKRGRPSAASALESTQPTNGDASPSVQPTPPPVDQNAPKVAASPVAGQKRKSPAEGITAVKPDQSEPSSKMRKMSTAEGSKPIPQKRKSIAGQGQVATESKQAPGQQIKLVEKASELQHPQRRRAAEALVKLFVDQTKDAQKHGIFEVPANQTVDTVGSKHGLLVEYALYMNHWDPAAEPRDQYKTQLLSILHNVKANKALRDQILQGELTADHLSRMTSEDMASQELKKLSEQMKREADKQHTLIQDDGPRIRRTHKGEEFIDDNMQYTGTQESIYTTTAPRRRESEILDEGQRHASPEQVSPTDDQHVELPAEILIAASPTMTKLSSTDTNVPRPAANAERKSSSTFNIQNVWSSVDTPDANEKRTRPSYPPIPIPSHHHPSARTQADADIDHLLKDEDADDEEPYSPKEYEEDPDVVWRGNMVMATIANFNGSAKWVAGANLKDSLPWPEVMPKTLSIEGRIAIEKASNYLCGLQWSKSTDLSIVAITPTDAIEDRIQFNKLFAYFTERSRYGVVKKSPAARVRDIYVVPLESGSAKKPDFIELLSDCEVGDNRLERSLLVAYVIKNRMDSDLSASAQATPRALDHGNMASPLSSQAPPQYRLQMPHAGSQMSPIGYPSGPSPSQQPFVGSPVQHQSSQQAFSPPPYTQPGQTPAQGMPGYSTFPGAAHQTPTPVVGDPPVAGGPTGMEAARQALGEMAESPSILELLKHAPNTGVDEFGKMRDVLLSNQDARADFATLMDVISKRLQS
ncbi:hypothetical protein MMC25_006839 [Agyrium rufum]|nr:hypothetical protein [Agyrium rufum]